ncbi:MAG: hypothetical protein EXS76_02400 [Nitrosarchaeum sp.]|nr:hypothetical protein [Nitrosarchaeum sp.]
MKCILLPCYWHLFFYICVVLIRSKSANDVQIEIDGLKERIEHLVNPTGMNDEDDTIRACGCQHSKNRPYCDDTHKSLK